MTNMMPQVHALNAGPWKGIETHERELVTKQGMDVYVVAGGLFGANPTTIGRGVAVPAASCRVTTVVQQGQGSSDVLATTPVLAVEMPNHASAKGRKWQSSQSASTSCCELGQSFGGCAPLRSVSTRRAGWKTESVQARPVRG